MKTGFSTIARAGIVALAMMTGGTSMTYAAPYSGISGGNAPATPSATTPRLVVEGEFRGGSNPVWRRNGGWDRREFRRDRWRNGDRQWRGDRGWRGDRKWRRGYRDNDRWRYGRRHSRNYYGPAILGLGLGLGYGALQYDYYAPPRRVYREVGGSHVQWCYNRYRSYRASDNTFQPYHGPRQFCYSPYR